MKREYNKKMDAIRINEAGTLMYIKKIITKRKEINKTNYIK